MTPNVEKIFEDIEPGEACAELSCRQLSYHGKREQVACCNATAAYECPRSRMMVDDVREFIRRNSDTLIYIHWG